MERHFSVSFQFLSVMVVFNLLVSGASAIGEQALAKIAIHNTILALKSDATISVTPLVLTGNTGKVKVTVYSPHGNVTLDWVGVFSPADFHDASTCKSEKGSPQLCHAPIKYMKLEKCKDKDNYNETGKATFELELINQRSDFSFALFTDGLEKPQLVAVTSNNVSFENPKAPVFPRLAQGKSWDEITVTWTSGYNIDEAYPFVEWGLNTTYDHGKSMYSPAGTLTFSQNTLCGEPARGVGWRHPGYIHTSFLRNLWPNAKYYYKLVHQLKDGTIIWSKTYNFRASPYPGQESKQGVVIFGDMGTGQRDGSNEYADYQPGALNTTDQLIKDLNQNKFGIVFLLGDISYANGYISEWDQFTAQVEPIASKVPFMVASGNHERDWFDSASFFNTGQSGGECGVPAETIYYTPSENRAKFWYSTDYGMFHFCMINSELDWRVGSEQYKFIENCLASVDRKHQPWLIFGAHRPLGYSSNRYYGEEGTFEEPEGRANLQKLWQKYRVDIAFFGHVHNYERTCPIYQNHCMKTGNFSYSGVMNGTIHVVVGGGGSHLNEFTSLNTSWSIYKDHDFGYVTLTATNRSSLLFEYKRSSDGLIYDNFTITREYKDVLACVHDGCEPTTLAV